MRLAIWLGSAALLVFVQDALATKVSSASFSSCEDAKAVVQQAGRSGIWLDRRVDRIFADSMCYRDSIPDSWDVFKEYVRVGGQRCHIGYSCSRTTAGPSR